jgi:hypothetical protein
VSYRPATVTQADVARVIRACRQEGLEIKRIVVRKDGVSIEAACDEGPEKSTGLEAIPVPVL